MSVKSSSMIFQLHLDEGKKKVEEEIDKIESLFKQVITYQQTPLQYY